MKILHQRLDYSTPWKFPDVYLFTGNPIITRAGGIVMGRGAAKQVRDMYPGVSISLANLINANPRSNVHYARINVDQHIGWFKVKDHWAEPAVLEIISDSVTHLTWDAESHPDWNFHINFPEIGNGRLQVPDVITLLSKLPDNVTIYQ